MGILGLVPGHGWAGQLWETSPDVSSAWECLTQFSEVNPGGQGREKEGKEREGRKGGERGKKKEDGRGGEGEERRGRRTEKREGGGKGTEEGEGVGGKMESWR